VVRLESGSFDDDDVVRVSKSLAEFSATFTALVDVCFGSDWAENPEILAMLRLRAARPPSTRQLSEASGMHRRAVSRLVGRLVADGIVTTSQHTHDRRVVLVETTAEGRRRIRRLRREFTQYLVDSKELAADIVARLRCDCEPTDPLPRDSLDLMADVCAVGAAISVASLSDEPELALSGRQRLALIRIAIDPPTRPVELMPALAASRPLVSYVAGQLEAKGLIVRHHGRPGGDRRAVLLEPTDVGRHIAQTVFRAVEDHRPQLCQVFTDMVAFATAATPSTRPIATSGTSSAQPTPLR
jgi:DNA-binding MarR family transcriptional regulator